MCCFPHFHLYYQPPKISHFYTLVSRNNILYVQTRIYFPPNFLYIFLFFFFTMCLMGFTILLNFLHISTFHCSFFTAVVGKKYQPFKNTTFPFSFSGPESEGSWKIFYFTNEWKSYSNHENKRSENDGETERRIKKIEKQEIRQYVENFLMW